MVTIYDVDSNRLIEKLALKLKEYPAIQAPEWAQFVKTGHFKQRPPVNSDWWYVRVAAVLRTIYLRGPIGVSKLRTKYGGKKDRGVRPEKFMRASGNILRKALQQLEIEKLVRKSPDDKDKGRIVTPQGQSLLEKTATSLIEKKPAKPTPSKESKKEDKKESQKEDKKESKKEDKKPETEKKSSEKTETKKEDKKETVKEDKKPETEKKSSEKDAAEDKKESTKKTAQKKPAQKKDDKDSDKSEKKAEETAKKSDAEDKKKQESE